MTSVHRPGGVSRWIGCFRSSAVLRVTVAFAAVLAAILLLATFGAVEALREQREGQWRNEAEIQAAAVLRDLEGTLHGFAGALAGLARHPLLAAPRPPAEDSARLSALLRDYDFRIGELLGITLCDGDGTPLASGGLGQAACFADAPAGSGPRNGRRQAFLVSDNRRLVYVLAEPAAAGTLVGRLDLSAWFEDRRHIPASVRAQIVAAGDGSRLAGSGEAPQPPLVLRRLNLPEAPADIALLLGLAEPVERAAGKVFTIAVAAAASLWAMGVLLLYGAIRRVLAPLRDFGAILGELAGGQSGLRAAVGRDDEIGSLARDLNSLLDRLEGERRDIERQGEECSRAALAGEREGRRRSQELAAILDAMPALVMVAGSQDCRFIRGNRALRDLLPPQPDADDAIPLERFCSLDPRHFGVPLAIEDWPLVKAARERIEVRDFACEIRLPSGETRHLLCNALPLFQEGQPAGAIAVLVDISALRQAERMVDEQEQRYRRLFDLMPEGVCVLDGERISMANEALARLADFERAEDMIGQHILSFVHVEDRAGFGTYLQPAVGIGGMYPLPFRLIRRDGSLRHAEVSTGIVQLDGGRLVQAVIRDITLRRQAEEQTSLAGCVFESSREGIFIADAARRIVSVNLAFSRRTGYGAEEMVGREMLALAAGIHDEAFLGQIDESLERTGRWEGELHCRHRNGELLADWVAISAVRGAAGETLHYIAVFLLSDLGAHASGGAQLTYLVQYDHLTGLPNRSLLGDRFERAIAKARRERCGVGLLFIDLDGFKAVNDAHGHAVGDQLLRLAAQRMQGELRAIDSVCRLGGDEFVALVVDLPDRITAGRLAEKLCRALARPYAAGGMEIDTVSASIGIVAFPDDGCTLTELLERADAAMYRAKRAGRNRFRFHGDDESAALAAGRRPVHTTLQ